MAYFPIDEGMVWTAEVAMEQTQLDTKAINILVVEDIAAFAAGVVAMLRYSLTNTSTIFVASSLHDAVHQLEEIEVSVVLLDLTLPDCCGVQAVTEIRSKTSAPIVVLSGQDDERDAIEGLNYGAHDYLLKAELNGRQLMRSINYAMERHRADQAEADVRRLRKRLDSFMLTISHDLKNPLIGANRVLESMVNDTDGSISDVQRDLLIRIRRSNDELLIMLRNVIDQCNSGRHQTTRDQQVVD